MAVTYAALPDDAAWNKLRAVLDPQSNIEAVRAVLAYAREIGAVCTIIEEEYLDRDFSAEFAAFYSKVFKRYSKLCRRIHFFSHSVASVANSADPLAIATELKQISDAGGYVGYIVARPVQHAPLGRVALGLPPSPAGMRSDQLVRSTFEAHLFGATLTVTASPFTQQDQRVAACAQASIWMAGRHFYSKHRGTWSSMVDITEAATKPTDQFLSQSLPAGSAGLTVDNMVRALRAMGREPLLYMGSWDQNTRAVTWPLALPPARVIDRYVDSGIPVIVGLAPWAPDQSILHAVVATGHTLKQLGATDQLPVQPTRSEFCEYFLVNDDQRGINLRLPLHGAGGQTPYSMDHVLYLIVPLPGKVYLPAEPAEKIAWDLLNSYSSSWAAIKAQYAAQLGASTGAGDQFMQDLAAGQVVARTYLTYGWRYKQSMIQNTCAPEVKDAVLAHDLPRYVWVTEFGTKANFNQLDERQVRISAHTVIDATSSIFWEGRSVFHAPGIILRWYHDPQNAQGPYVNALSPIKDDVVYGMKIRGS